MGTTARTIIVFLSFIVFFQSQSFAQWNQVATAPTRHRGYQLAYDSVRQVVVMFGGKGYARETWEWNGEFWALASRTGPVNRIYHALAYDRARGVMLLYGGKRIDENGETREALGDMWAWDGTGWEMVSVKNPSKRFAHSMDYDRARREVLLFGGEKQSGEISRETFAWNGQKWRRRSMVGPSLRINQAMAYDRGRRKVVLYGGGYSNNLFSDTWEWDGQSWSEKFSEVNPGSVRRPKMAYDEKRGVTVLIETDYGSYPQDTVWEWDGRRWKTGVPTGGVNMRESAIAYDVARGCCVVFENNTDCYLSTWLYDGTSWKFSEILWPQPRSRPAMAYDSRTDKLVLFGGNLGTAWGGRVWEWDGRAWKSYPALGPSARRGCVMVYDESRGRTLLFGGAHWWEGEEYKCTDLWGWDSKKRRWTQFPEGGPPLENAAAAYNSDRDVVVVFGGEVEAPYTTVYSKKTWEWKDGLWTSREMTGPSQRARFGMAYDESRKRIVLYGGMGQDYSGSSKLYDDTWEYDGNVWRRISVTGPGTLYGHSLVYDPALRACVLFGGAAAVYDNRPFQETWAFDGTSWKKLNESAPRATWGNAATYDSRRGQVVTFGGAGGAELWHLGIDKPVVAHGSDFDGNGTADIAVYEPDTAIWRVYGIFDRRLGKAGDIPVCGDFRGTGKADLGYFRPSAGYWKLKRVKAISGFGQEGDIPVPGDYDGDGRTDVAFYRPSEGAWYVYKGETVLVGQPGDLPVPGDYDGDGKTDMVVYRPSQGKWIFTGGSEIEFGRSDDIPVPADYNGDGKAEIAVFKPDNGGWVIVGMKNRKLGRIGDIPVPADYDGDGKADIAVFRPATGEWIILGRQPIVFGRFGDIPIAGTR